MSEKPKRESKATITTISSATTGRGGVPASHQQQQYAAGPVRLRKQESPNRISSDTPDMRMRCTEGTVSST
jgi:hypothetical protein